MEDKIKGKKSQLEPSLFHFYLTKLLVLEEINKRKKSWQSFVDSSKLVYDVPTSPLSKKETPSVVVKDIQSPIGILVKRSSATVQYIGKKKGKKLQFSPEVVISPSTAKNIPLEKTFETMETILEDEVVDDKVRDI